MQTVDQLDLALSENAWRLVEKYRRGEAADAFVARLLEETLAHRELLEAEHDEMIQAAIRAGLPMTELESIRVGEELRGHELTALHEMGMRR